MQRTTTRVSVLPRFCLATVMATGCGTDLTASESNKLDGTLFLSQFNSLSLAEVAAGSAEMTSEGASLVPGKSGRGVQIRPGGYLAISSDGNLATKQGTLMFWFKPNWSTTGRESSHTLFSWGWDDDKSGYCVLSDGWWEPEGSAFTYLVFDNQLYLHCHSPVTFVKDQWMHVAVTWQFDKQAFARFYVDGCQVATAVRPYESAPALRTPIFLGTDKATPSTRGRSADGVFDSVRILNRMLTKQDVRDVFRDQAPNWRAIERRREAWLYDVLEKPYKPKRNEQGRIQESRALLDEWGRWASRKGAEESLDKMSRAGFNVYIPCIWHGRGARWPSRLTPMETAIESILDEEDTGFDPLENLIRSAHARGIQVHPWFCVCYGDPQWKPLEPFIEEGTPRGACEVHNPAFRKFIVELMMEVVKRYDIDGVNLDYIRTKGLSTSATAQASYRKRFGAELLDDMKKLRPNGWPNPNIVRWQNEAVADIVRSISRKARAARPDLVISVDGHPYLPTDKPGTQGRDGFWWAQEGWIDVIYSMDYSRRISWRKTDAIRAALDRPAAAAIITGNYEREENGGVASRDGQLVADLVGFCQRKYPGNGVALYWYGALDDAQIEALRGGPFREPAEPYWQRAAAAPEVLTNDQTPPANEKGRIQTSRSLRIVALGDSITNGVSLAGVSEADTFRDIVRRELTDRLKSKVVVVNAGVNGDIVTQAIHRLKSDVVDRKPDVVTIMFGANEAGFYRPETKGFADTPRVGRDEFKAAIGKIVDRLRGQGITVVLMTCPPMTERYWGMHLAPYQEHGINFLVKNYAQGMREVAAEKHVELVDVYQAFQQTQSRLDYFPDGLHPDARGHRVIADLLIKRLTRIIADSK